MKAGSGNRRAAAVRIRIANQQDRLALDRGRLRKAVRTVLADAAIARADISLAVIDDPAMAALNQQFLGHEGPTDVLSFVLDSGEGWLEGEVVVSADTAERQAPQFGWPAHDELLLYIVHGMLHMVGYDDRTPRQRSAMRRQERACLERIGDGG